jgi:shikimate dehydrogenase
MFLGLIGWPLGHSLSPQVHKLLSERDGGQSDYGLFALPPDRFDIEMPALAAKLTAFNVTVPYKTRVIPYCRALSDEARFFSSVNFVYGGVGYNTDVVGVRKSLERLGVKIGGNEGKATKICLLGYGGSGKMIAREMLRQGAGLTVALRNPSKAADLAGSGAIVTAIGELQGDFDLVINSTNAGMFPECEMLPDGFAPDRITARFAFDIVYNPRETRFLREMAKNGAQTLNGMSMLVWQAAAARAILYGKQMDDDAVRAVIERMSVPSEG